MKRAIVAGLGVVLGAACTLYTLPPAVDEPTDGGVEAGGPVTNPDATSPANDGGSSGFVPQTVPEWKVSWESDAGIDDVTVGIVASCPEFEVTGGSLSGNTYRYTSACFSEARFVEPFQEACPGMRANNGKAKARVNGTIVGTSTTKLNRTGTLWTAAEIIAPCRTAAGTSSSCSALGFVVKQQLVSSSPAGTQVELNCYDTALTECTCHLEIVSPLSEDGIGYDSAAGTFDKGKFIYGLSSGSTLRFRGAEGRSFSVEPAMYWTLRD